MSIKYKITLSMLAVSFVPLVPCGYFFDMVSHRAIESKIYAHLNSVSTLKKNQLNNYMNAVKGEIEHVASIDALVAYMEHEQFDPKSITATETDTVITRLNSVFGGGPFVDLFLLDPNGRVTVPLQRSTVGIMKDTESYFVNGKQGLYVQNFYRDKATGAVISSASFPIFDSTGQTLTGVAVGIIDPSAVAELMNERSGLGDTGETYLVNKEGVIIAGSRLANDKETTLLLTPVGKDCLVGKSAYGIYDDYRGVSVVGSYSWLPEHDACLLAEIDSTEAFGEIRRLEYVWLFFTLALVLLSFAIGLVLARRISEPITMLIKTVEDFTKHPERKSPLVSSTGEVGVLASAFEKMSGELADSRNKLENMNIHLESLVRERTSQLEGKNKELERFNKLMIGRELKMIELKETIKQLEEQLGEQKSS